jgi:hypothetical protein
MKSSNKVIIIVIVFFAVTVGVFYFISQKMQRIQGNIALTKQLSPSLIEALKGKQAGDFPYTPAVVAWEGKYLQIDHAAVETENYGYLNFSYNEQRNKKLNTDRFFPGNDINGVVWVYTDFKNVGEYVGGAYAAQPYYLLFYLDLKQQAVLATDTVWGGTPPQSISKGASGGVGKLPKEKELIETIKSRMQ